VPYESTNRRYFDNARHSVGCACTARFSTSNGPNFKTHPSHRLLGNIQPAFREQILGGRPLYQNQIACHNGGEAALKVNGCTLQQAARCVARPILNLGLLSANVRFAVTDQRAARSNLRRIAGAGAGALNRFMKQRRWPMRFCSKAQSDTRIMRVASDPGSRRRSRQQDEKGPTAAFRIGARHLS
jgi:hypothetical protein